MSPMKITAGHKGREDRIVAVMRDAFAASEGPDAGALIAGLATGVLTDTSEADLRAFCAEDEGEIIGAGLFTRLDYANDPRHVMLLSPMAVATDRQRQGIGQALLTHALAALREEGVDIAITYGDPAYYGQVGFHPITEAEARAPLPLSMPHGWIGQTLSGDPFPNLKGPSTCATALNRADIW